MIIKEIFQKGMKWSMKNPIKSIIASYLIYDTTLDQETKNILGINEKTLDLIKNCSLEQLQEMNKNR